MPSALQLMLEAGPVVKGVLLILFFFSACSWAIIGYKYWHFTAAARQSDDFVNAFHQHRNRQDIAPLLMMAKTLPLSPVANVFQGVCSNHLARHPEERRRLVSRYEALESAKLESRLTFLATTGSTTPFIGLFGTVWGIMDSFRSIGAAGSASLAIVAPGIAEALIATAVGLAAAIPAVVAYNYYLSRARRLAIAMEDFSQELLTLAGPSSS
ncbi:MAG: MotA/TolQ/ExbB proton channel family protein [Candidatus Omnitrophica bacterium]|nr:MotA/TolQ/ExbB proton channel family protein [Candidatus Omnitrophota bacterium]